jgi:nucleotide-binding universal stress UspA family protein
MSSGNVVPFQQRGSPLFETMLVPTDGSALSIAAALKAVALAKRLDARVIVFTSVPSYQYPVYVGGIPFEFPSEVDYERQCRNIADRYLNIVVQAAEAIGVQATTRIEYNGGPAQAIVAVAKKENCSMIFMGSHGRSGISQVFLGSIALKTLTLSEVPVMVDHPNPQEISFAEDLMHSHAVDP